ncbi:MAG TPA: hypothetical protein PK668_24810 [Myxococcota bacterium]|nr:hypothetical protein [Myxococcota bacterium]HRY96838.1 hypothetical protein [Myxococcota bacterium]
MASERGSGAGWDRSVGPALAGLGCLATGGQVLLLRELLAVFSGHELAIGVVFGAWFTGIALGAALGGRLASRLDARAALAGLTALGAALPWALLGLSVLARAWRGLLGVPPGELPGLGELGAAVLLLVTPFSALVGLSFPLACRAAAADPGDARAIGRVYVLESLGAVAGAVLPVGLAAARLPPFEAMGLLGLPLLLGLALAGRPWRPRPRLSWLALGCLIGLTGLGAAGGLRAWDGSSAERRFADLGTGGRLLASADTPYQHLDLAEAGGQYDLFADGKVLVSFPDAARARTRTHLVLTQHPAPRRALFLAEAPLGLIAPALRHQLERLDLVSLDPGVAELVEPYLDEEERAARRDARVGLHATDGRRFLQASSERWDVIFSDAPEPTTAAANRFYTLEFFALARARLAPGGVLATRLGSQVGLLDEDTAQAVRTLERGLAHTFAHVLVLPGDESLLFASDDAGALLGEPVALAERFRARGVADPAFHPGWFSQLVQRDEVDDLARQLARREAPHNTDARPVSYLQTLVRWSRREGDPAAVALRGLAGVPAWAWGLGLVLALLLPLALLGRPAGPPGRGARALAAVAVTAVGGLGISLELGLSFAYQSLAGSLYQELGLLVAAFMLGLVLGGLAVQRALARRPADPPGARALGLTLLGAAAGAGLLPWLLGPWLAAWPLAAIQAWVLLLCLAAGAATGLSFPLASALAMRAGQPLGAAAGRLDALDHLGAALGAACTGLVWLPALGRDATGALLALSILVVAGWCLVVHPGEPRPGAAAGGGR